MRASQGVGWRRSRLLEFGQFRFQRDQSCGTPPLNRRLQILKRVGVVNLTGVLNSQREAGIGEIALVENVPVARHILGCGRFRNRRFVRHPQPCHQDDNGDDACQ